MWLVKGTGQFDILPALKGEDSPKGIFRLRVSSALKDAFAWNVDGCHRIVTDGVRYSVIRNQRFLIGSKIATRFSNASSRVNAAFLPGHAGRPQKSKTSGVRTRRSASR